MTVADFVAGKDEFGDKAMSNGQNPASHEGEKSLRAGASEDTAKGNEQLVKAVGKMFHGRPSLAWGWCGNPPMSQGSRLSI